MRSTTISEETTTTLPVIEFVTPLPGFPRHRSFMLVRLDDDGLLYELASVDDPELRFVVVPPAPFFPEYTPEVSEESLELLGITAAEVDQLLTLLVVTVGSTPSRTTANLLAPILIDPVRLRALQVILAGTDNPVRAPLRSAA
ncbi:flagellar assembly protein FliW [Luedemannella flava]|uniref:flagellar assembly protein FliW n=1 Tax=Luedemannella flava TaxID=349316 RepID=UPI0031DBD3E9